MGYKEFLNKYYLGEFNPKPLRIIKIQLIAGIIFILASGLWAHSLVKITNDLVQKENVYNVDKEYQVNLSIFETEEISYEDYYRNLEVKVPKYIYAYFGVCILSFAFWVENFVDTLILHKKVKKQNEDSIV